MVIDQTIVELLSKYGRDLPLPAERPIIRRKSVRLLWHQCHERDALGKKDRTESIRLETLAPFSESQAHAWKLVHLLDGHHHITPWRWRDRRPGGGDRVVMGVTRQGFRGRSAGVRRGD